MFNVAVDDCFETWRNTARDLVANGIAPESIVWSNHDQGQLFVSLEPAAGGDKLTVPASFLDLARTASCYDDPHRWSLFYRILFRLVHDNRNLIAIESDPDIRLLNTMAKAVRRDVHKFHAFVRFRKVDCDDKEIYVAWHEPHHFTVEMATPFFARRFGTMRFSILTPKGCAHWDRRELTFSPPADRSLAPSKDETEEFWLLYYRSIFNPFRLKVNTMKRELPVRHWPTLPEAALIPELVRRAASE